MQDHGWFQVREFAGGVVGIGEPGHSEDVKSYLIRGRDRSLLFDTGMGLGNIRDLVQTLVDSPLLVVNSHSHWDHIGDNWRFERIWIHEAEADRLLTGVASERLRRWLTPEHLHRPLPAGVDPQAFAIPPSRAERTLVGGEVIDLGDRSLMVVPTPGHSPGGITLWEEHTGALFVGDAVYAGPLYAHVHDADLPAYRETLRRLAGMASSASTVYPSHNDYPLSPTVLVEVHEAMEQIWDGRKPDRVDEGVERYLFQGFSFLLREGWRGE